MKRIFVFMVMAVLTAAMATSVVMQNPEFWQDNMGNPSCKDLGYSNEYKAEEETLVSGSHLGGKITLMLDDEEEPVYFDWSSTFGIDAVIAKGGNVANVYFYDPASMGDTGLVSPINPANEKPYGLSHVTFCWDEPDYEIPEFGVIASVAVLGLAGLYIAMKRK